MCIPYSNKMSSEGVKKSATVVDISYAVFV